MWKYIWTIILAMNLFEWSTYWILLGESPDTPGFDRILYFWMPLSGALVVFSAVQFLKHAKKDALTAEEYEKNLNE